MESGTRMVHGRDGSPSGGFAGRHAPWLAGIAFAALAVVAASAADAPAAAIYGASFWHYYLYWLAYRYRTVALGVFKRDAAIAKGFALAALAAAYFAYPLDALSLALVAAGFGLNVAGVVALGSDRTYYGHEVAGLPARRVSAFPYCVVAHPMLVGNMLAFGATLLNEGFRAGWWPLACAHVALNAGLLVMETRDAGSIAMPVFLAAAAGLALIAAASAGLLFATLISATALAYGYLLHRRYTAPAPAIESIGKEATS